MNSGVDIYINNALADADSIYLINDNLFSANGTNITSFPYFNNDSAVYNLYQNDQNTGGVNVLSITRSILPGSLEVIFTNIPLSGPPQLTNICFPSGTLVQTDQGKIAIDQINPYIHTINRKTIIHITKTITTDEYLVEFKKNALGTNFPNQNTVISYEHKILFNGQMCTARSFLNKFNNVVRVKYTGEFLYNVLMEEHSKMNVNNLICETLHPNNEIARLYNKKD